MEKSTNTGKKSHTWRFFRNCGFDQVMFEKGADLENLDQLDQKLWTALSCPTTNIRFDATTLTMLDTDADGRIRVPEILGAIEWLKQRLTNLDSMLTASDTVELAHINTATEEGKELLANAKRILKNMGKADSTTISLNDISDTAAIFTQTNFNGDGVIPADVSECAETARIIECIIKCIGAETDRSGKPGVNQAKVDEFFAAVDSRITWLEEGNNNPEIMILKDETANAFAALQAVRAKIDDYFTRCSMVEYHANSQDALNCSETQITVLADQELTNSTAEMALLPLATIKPGRELSLTTGINPFWHGAMEKFAALVVKPLLDGEDTTLTMSQWQGLKDRFTPFAGWQAENPGAELAELDLSELQTIAAGQTQKTITELIAQDAAVEPEYARITEVERLLRYHAYLIELLRNYVNMGQLYNPEATALFQVGTLYMDARACTLCFEVKGEDVHAALAEASKCCLAYCRLTRKDAEPRTICAVFTAGFSHSLWVGRNGIFYDFENCDWDATIIKIVENALSLREAFWDPWRKIGAMISSQVSKMLAAKHDNMLASVSKQVETPAAALSEPPKKMEGAALASSVAAIGIAVGLLGSAIGGIISVMAGLPLWKTLIGIAAIMLLVSGPSVVLAWFKLRARDLAPILNACGWAINRRLRFSLKLGRLFTTLASLPDGTKLELTDPYADKNTLRNTLLIILVLAVLLALLSTRLPGI